MHVGGGGGGGGWGERNGCSSGTRSEKEIERKILRVHVCMDFFFLESCFV